MHPGNGYQKCGQLLYKCFPKIQSSNAVKSYGMASEKQLEILDNAWEELHTKIVSFVAWGGVGKSALINAWLNNMEAHNYKGAERVYGWSFYSQGTKERGQASADEFFNDAFKWFG